MRAVTHWVYALLLSLLVPTASADGQAAPRVLVVRDILYRHELGREL